MKKNHDAPYPRLTDGALLDRIRDGDSLAETYLMETYLTTALTHATHILYGQPQQLGDPGDYAHHSLLELLVKARRLGAAVFKEENRTISGWLKQTATFQLYNAIRKDRFDRDDWQADSDSEEGRPSVTDTLEDDRADVLATLADAERGRLIRTILSTLPNELQTLIRLKFMDGFSWEETAELMAGLYPGNDPPFRLAYLQKTYWDRVHKTPFRKLFIDTFKRYGYDS